METNRKLTTVFILALVAFMVSGGSAASASPATIQKLPACTDPTGQDLPCMMIISTLPAPVNALQCQETAGQILPCSYATQNLSNGEQIVVITVYVPANYVFTGYGQWTVVKEVIHETKTRIVHEPPSCERADANAKTDLDKNLTTVDCDINDANEHGKIKGCERADANAKTDPDTDLKTIDCDLGDANEHFKTPPPPPSCNSANYNGTCPTTNNMTVAASGGKGTGPSCVDNCTTGTPPPVNCTKTPNDPSCTQTLTPSTTSPTTKTCPDGSVIDASATCPTNTPPSNSPPPSSSTPPSPPSSSKPSDNGGGTASGGGGSDKGSSSSQPSRLQ
jgi:hypothetical protein